MEVYNAKSEYDAFGPWINELHDKKQLPPLFSSHYREAISPLMLIEIPRNIERRNAKQGMNLYDYVLGMYEDHVYLLERKENAIVESKIPYGEIDMIEDFRDLLSGKLTIFTKGRKIEIFYSTVSGDTIANAVKIIRNGYARKTYDSVKGFIHRTPDTEALYKNLLISMKSKGDDFDISVVQPSIAVNTANRSFFIKLLNAVIRKEVLPSLHLSNSKELLIISRGKSFKHLDPVHSYALNYIPIEKIQGIELINDNVYSNLYRLNIRIENYTHMLYIDSNNKAAQEYYTSLRKIISICR